VREEGRSADFTARARASFFGLALGDGHGRPLEFVTGTQVRTMPVEGTLVPTDDTHMSLYLARAIEDQVLGFFDADRFGQAVAARFTQWIEDPITPSTAPGNTCMAGVRNFIRGGDWRTCGVPTSDGCGAVMRITPLPIVFSGEALTDAARIQAIVTHAHPNAPEAAIAGSHLLRWLLEGEALTPALVLRAIKGLSGPWRLGGGSTARALGAAIELSASDATWLDDRAIPDGDGGWRSPSALGLAVAAALRWGTGPDADFATAIDKAARIDGDSDSVACLTGMLLGASGLALPEDWLARLDWKPEIEAALARLGC
jgi:ADP-ribosylglycohydrolase